MDVKLYIENEGDILPPGIMKSADGQWTIGDRVIAAQGEGHTIKLGEGVRVEEGKLLLNVGMGGDVSISTHPRCYTTALRIEGVNADWAMDNAKKYPAWVIVKGVEG